jgi:hypothetical protein
VIALALLVATASADDATCALVKNQPAAVVVEADGDPSRLAVDAIFTLLKARCVSLMPPALGVGDPIDAAKAVGAAVALHLHVTTTASPNKLIEPGHKEWKQRVEARVVSVSDRVVLGVVDSSRKLIGDSPSSAVKSFLDSGVGKSTDNIIAPAIDQIVALLAAHATSPAAHATPKPSASGSGTALCEQLKALPLKLLPAGTTEGSGLNTKHFDDVIARCQPSGGDTYSIVLFVSANADKPHFPAHASVNGLLKETKQGGATIATISEERMAPLIQAEFDAMIDEALTQIAYSVRAHLAGESGHDASEEKNCKVVANAPLVLLVDSDADEVRLVVGEITERLRKHCVKLMQPAAGHTADPVEAARAVGAGHALQIHVGMKDSDKTNALIEGTRMTSYTLSVEAKIVAAADHAIIADVVHSSNVLGISPENAVRAITNNPQDKVIGVTADDIAERFAYALSAAR